VIHGNLAALFEVDHDANQPIHRSAGDGDNGSQEKAAGVLLFRS
jgi:hypothetical protein